MPEQKTSPKFLIISEIWKFQKYSNSLFPKKTSEKQYFHIRDIQRSPFLASCETILSNGILKFCQPPAFEQLYVILEGNERKLPLVFSFVSGKSTSIYRKIFDIIIQKFQKMGAPIQIVNVVVTTKGALFRSLKQIFPHGTISVVTFTIPR